jgi:hypothetical protein
MTAPISKSASEAAAEIEGFYNAASEYTCTCFSEPDSGCSHCRAWTKAYNETITTIQSAIDTERQKDAEMIAQLEQQLPDTYYAGLPLLQRLHFMVNDWRRGVIACQKLDDDNASLTKQVEELGADKARLDWLDGRMIDGVHVEVWAKGDPEVKVEREAVVYLGTCTARASHTRLAIDAAMRCKDTPTNHPHH